MSDPGIDQRRERIAHFRTNTLAWASLYHFLPADLLNEFSHALIDAVSAGQDNFDRLFEMELREADGGLSDWIIRPRQITDSVGQYLQRRIRQFVWAGDNEAQTDPQKADEFTGLQPELLEYAVTLGSCDLRLLPMAFEQLVFPESDSISLLIKALHVLVEDGNAEPRADTADRISAVAAALDGPLQGIMVKHVGDVAADADQWELARALYRRSTVCLENCTRSAVWAPYANMIRAQVMQSLATAERVIDGPRAATGLIVTMAEGGRLTDAPIPVLNASHDAFVAQTLSREPLDLVPDRRATISRSPLLLNTLDLTPAFRAWIAGDHRSATRLFWSVLRRQIALGSATETRTTKGFYARALFDKVEKTIERDIARDEFRVAVEIAVQSGAVQLFEKLNWNSKVVSTYVTYDVLALLTAQLRYSETTVEERLQVAVELLRGWCLALPPQEAQRAAWMVTFVARQAVIGRSSFFGQKNIGGRCLEILSSIVTRRPEFRFGSCNAICEAILAKLNVNEWWTAAAEAAKLAEHCVDVFDAETVRAVTRAILAMLQQIDPAQGVWPVVYPALSFLAQTAVRDATKDDALLSTQIASAILRFGFGHTTQYAGLLYNLYRFDIRSVGEEGAVKLKGVVDQVRKQALQINSTNAVANIQALLVAAWAAGQDGVRDALEAVQGILKSASGERRTTALALPHAYDAITFLADSRHTIAREIGLEPDEFRSWLHPLIGELVKVWTAAEKEPAIFASFSFPPARKPNPVIIHNWAFASIALAKSLGEPELIDAALVSASKVPALKDSIATARAIRAAPDELGTLDAGTILGESSDAFYAALGQRLTVFHALSKQARDPLLLALLQQCFAYGPRGLDAAVFLACGSERIDGFRESPSFKDYEKRVRNDRELRLALLPFLQAGTGAYA